MVRANFTWVAALWLASLAGCQCSPLTRNYANFIDDVSECDLAMDAFYRPTWDLNRIGKPDWCQSAFNRWWCRCDGCDQYCSYNSLDDPMDVEEYDADNDRFDGEPDAPAGPPPYEETPPVQPIPQPPPPLEAGPSPPVERDRDALSLAPTPQK